MLFHSHVPLYLWVETFTTSIFLLNRLSFSSLCFDAPFFKLHGTHPDYTSLGVFGFKCFSYIWDIKRHKFDPKFVLYVFVGYSEKHKGYKYFHLSMKKFLISQHVFYESVFPFKFSSSVAASNIFLLLIALH